MTDDDIWMRPAEVAKLFRVDPRTVTRWSQQGLLRSIRTPGKHRRFLKADVDKMLALPSEEASSGEAQV